MGRPALTLVCSLVLVAGLSSCAYVQKAAFKSADAAVAYCENSTALSRSVVQDQLLPAATEKDIAVCLRCPGDTVTHCTGDTKSFAP